MAAHLDASAGSVERDIETSRFPLSLRVKAARHLADGVLGLEFVDAANGALPPWTAGAHIDVKLPSGATRSYSLCGNLDDAGSYQVAVLNDPNGRGASREVHSSDLVGRVLSVSLPRNHFELIHAPHIVFIAGGIGITPLLPMVQEVIARGGSWEMHYLGRSRSSMAFLDSLAERAASTRARFTVVARDECDRIAVADLLAGAPPGSAVYCCGPERLIREVEQLHAGGIPFDLHVERFGSALTPEPGSGVSLAQGDAGRESLVPDFAAACDPDGPFTVELRQSGHVLEVGAGQSILECAREVRSGLSFSCSDGYCGTCETAVVAGTPDHRDTVLSDEERAESRTMMICVGRSRTRRLALDL